MKFNLGVPPEITAINDGGIIIRYNAGDGPIIFQPSSARPVLSVEVNPRRFAAHCRQNEDRLLNESRTGKKPIFSTQAKCSAKCLAKPATRNSMRIRKWNTRR